MNITLIALDRELYCIGIRILSSCLLKAGHQVQTIFLPPQYDANEKLFKFQTEYSSSLLHEVTSLCRNADMIGFSLMTNQFIQAARVSDFLKGQGILAPIIWGGIHPTVEPEECLNHADMVCVGEGEDALLELVNKMEHGYPYHDTGNMWFAAENAIIRNPVRPLEQDIDKIPLPDYSCKNHFIARGDRIEELTKGRLVHFKGERFNADGKAIHYPIMTSRGCPFNCTYCCNDVYKRLYHKQKSLRWRSVDNLLEELKMIQSEVAPISFVLIIDDNFTAKPVNELREFCQLYRKEIGIPFFCQCSPLTITEEKMDVLIDAGCAKITMGVETANERIAQMYNRTQFHKAVPAAISIIEKNRSRMPCPPSYQFIIDNPFETVDETLETLQFAVGLPRPWDNPIYSLMLYPGTTLYEKASRAGHVSDKFSQIYSRDWLEQSRPFFQLWIRLYRANFSPHLLRVMLKPWIAKFLTSRIVNAIWKTSIFRWLWKKEL